MLPPPAALRCGMACLLPNSTPLTFTACTLSHSASVISWVSLVDPEIPALLTSTCTPPNSAAASSMAFFTAASSLTSTCQ